MKCESCRYYTYFLWLDRKNPVVHDCLLAVHEDKETCKLYVEKSDDDDEIC